MSGIETWAGLLSRPLADAAQVRRYQERRLRPIVAQACLHVPYYRRLFNRAGLKPEHVRTLDDLTRLPITTKQDLQQVPLEDRLAEGAPAERCFRSTTSGSTGQPTVVLRSRTEDVILRALRLRAQVIAGLRPTDRRVFLRGHPTEKPRVHHRLGIFEQIEVDSCLDGHQILEQLRVLAPDVVRGQPQTLNRVAQVMEACGERPIRPRLVFSGADMLTPGVRRRIEEAFGSAIVDFYGTDEFDLLAWECRGCGQYHTCDDGVILEIVTNNGPATPGEEGQVVVTGLHSFVMPFLRLNVGDLARRPLGAEGCNTHFGAIEQPVGRSRDFLPLPGGGALSPSKIELGLRDVGGLARYHVVQQALDQVVVYYEPLPAASDRLAALIEERCKRIFPSEISFTVCLMDDRMSDHEKWRVIQSYSDAER